MLHQSITAESGHRLGSIVMLPSMRGVGLADAGERVDRRDFAQRQVDAWHRFIAHDFAFDEAAQARARIVLFGLRRNFEARPRASTDKK